MSAGREISSLVVERDAGDLARGCGRRAIFLRQAEAEVIDDLEDGCSGDHPVTTSSDVSRGLRVGGRPSGDEWQPAKPLRLVEELADLVRTQVPEGRQLVHSGFSGYPGCSGPDSFDRGFWGVCGAGPLYRFGVGEPSDRRTHQAKTGWWRQGKRRLALRPQIRAAAC